MKKTLLTLGLAVIFLLTGCAPKEVDIDNLKENYTSVISMPYAKFIGNNIEDVKKEVDNLIYVEEKNIYYVDKPILSFAPYLYVNEDNIVKITGFEINKNVDENVVTFIKGIQNMLSSYYGNVKIDPDIKKRVNSINDISMCKNGESYKEVWDWEGFPIEYLVSFENDTAIIKIQYNKDVNLKK